MKLPFGVTGAPKGRRGRQQGVPISNIKFLKEKLKWWANSDLNSLMKHCQQIWAQLANR